MTHDYRSDLRAQWLRTLVSLGLSPMRQPSPIAIGDGVVFRPDFYLPASQQYLVVTPVLDHIQERILALAAESVGARLLGIEAGADMPIIALSVTGIVIGFVRASSGLFEQGDGSLETWRAHPHATGEVALTRCCRCDGWYFADASQGWSCQVLGCPYGGDHDVEQLQTPLRPFPISAYIKRAS